MKEHSNAQMQDREVRHHMHRVRSLLAYTFLAVVIMALHLAAFIYFNLVVR